MNKQSTQETELNSNHGGSTIRFGGSFAKKPDDKKNFEKHIYSDIKHNNKPSDMGGSNIKVQNPESDDDDPMSFLDDIINLNPNNNHATMSHNRRIPQMHKDAEQLRHLYNDNTLTVVSEEASTRQTVILENNLSKKFSEKGMFPFESDITSSPSPISGHNLNHFKNNQKFNYSQQSGGYKKFNISGSPGNPEPNSEIVFRMNRTKSAFLNPNQYKLNNPLPNLKRNKPQTKSMSEMDDILEQSKHETSHDSGNLIPQSPIMRVASEGTPIIQRRFLPDDEDKPKKKFFGNLQPLKPQIVEFDSNGLEESLPMNSASIYKNQKQWTQLPSIPERPNYEISFLNGISNKKEIHKKQGRVDNIIFKLSDKGLYYEGGLSFGKLTGNGLLLLSMVDTSDLTAPEVKENLLYQGQFNQNMVEGRGVIFFKNNGKFEGSFVNGVAHGAGKLVTPDGEVIAGIWLQGKFNI